MFWGLFVINLLSYGINLLSYEVHKSVYLGMSGVLNQTPKNTSDVLGFVRNKLLSYGINLLSYEVHKSVYLGLSGVLIQTPKNTPYVLGFVWNLFGVCLGFDRSDVVCLKIICFHSHTPRNPFQLFSWFSLVYLTDVTQISLIINKLIKVKYKRKRIKKEFRIQLKPDQNRKR